MSASPSEPPVPPRVAVGGGALHAVLPGLPCPALLALMLDGRLAATLLVPAPAPGQAPSLRHPLPGHLLPSVLDLVDARSGRSVLSRPLDLAGLHRLEMGELALEPGVVLAGAFALGWEAAGPLLGVEVMDGARVVARGLAWAEGAVAEGAGPAGRIYRFRAPLAELPRAEAVLLVPHVGGRAVPERALAVDGREIGLVGFQEAVEGGAVRGWAADLRQPGRRVSLDLLVDGVVAATAVADVVREDLREAGLVEGAGGVLVPLPPRPADLPWGGARLVGLAVSGTGMMLPGGPVVVRETPLQGRLDRAHGLALHGWALDRARPGGRVAVEAVGPDGAVLARGVADEFRGDLLERGIGDGRHAFRLPLGARFLDLVGEKVSVRDAATGEALEGSPLVLEANPNLVRFLRRRERVTATALPRLRRMMAHRLRGAALTVVMPVHDTPAEWLKQALLSVHAQWCPSWELLCVDDASGAAHVPDILAQAAAQDPRIRVLRSPRNVGIAGAVNFGIRAARHGLVTVLDHDDALEPDAVWRLLRAAVDTGADVITADEATTDEDLDGILEVRARPAFSHDYYLSHPYVVHPVCVRTELARAVGGWDEGMAISADVDFVLRALERARAVAHVPAVLYRWRTHGGSTGHSKQEAVMAATRGAIQRHLDRLGTGAVVTDGVWFNQFRVDWPAASGPVLVVIPTRNRGELVRGCVDSLALTLRGEQLRVVVVDHESDEPETLAVLRELEGRGVTVMPHHGPFNYAAMNNAAVRAYGAGCPFVLFLNNDVEAIQPGWVDRLRSLAARPGVGAVGCLLLYGDRRVQHAGVVVGFNGSAEHEFKFADAFLDEQGRRNLGYNCALTSVRDVSAVTAACLLMRRDAFERVGGFDEGFAIGFNDTDLCLRLRAAGLSVLYDGHTMLFHHESSTRARTGQVFHPEDTARLLERWGGLLRTGDPFYSPLLSLSTTDHVLREDAGCGGTHRPLVTVLRG